MLEVEHLDAGYRSVPVLRRLTFTVAAGQFVGIIAPNGTGKSTLLKTVAGLLPPLAGTIRLLDRDLPSYSRRELARKIAMVSSDIAGYDYTAYQLVLMGRYPHWSRFSGPGKADQALVQEVMEEVGIWDKRMDQCHELSQGERQKVLIARALAQQPRLLLLDEPTAHLDIPNQYGVLDLIKNLASHKGLAVMAVLHDINLALAYSTDLLLLKEGEILAYGHPAEAATPAHLKALYGMEFTLYSDAAATYVRPNVNGT